MQATWDEGCRVEILAKLAPYASYEPNGSEALLPRLLEMVETIEDQGYRVWLLAELEAPLTGKLKGSHFDMLSTFQAIKDKEERLHTLLAIVPRLSEEALSKIFGLMLPEVFGFMWLIQGEERRAHMLAKLGGRLPEAWLQRAMERVRMMGDEAYQVRVLVAMAPRIQTGNAARPRLASLSRSEKKSRIQTGNAARSRLASLSRSEKEPRIGERLLSEALDIVRAMKDREKRAQVLEVLVSSLPEEGKGERVQEMLQVLQVIKDEADRAHVVVEGAAYLPEKLLSERTRVVVEAMRAMRYETNQARVLKALASHLPEDMFEEALGVVQEMPSEEERAQMLEMLAPRVPESLLPQFLRVVQAIQSERWRAQVLRVAGSLVKQISPALLYPALHEILHVLAQRTRGDALVDLALLAPVISALGGEEAVAGACCATLEVGWWWP